MFQQRKGNFNVLLRFVFTEVNSTFLAEFSSIRSYLTLEITAGVQVIHRKSTYISKI